MKSADEIVFQNFSTYDDTISFSLFKGQEAVSHASVLLCAPKHFNFIDPHLTVYAEGSEIVVTSEAFAKGVFIDNAEGDLKLDDNWFDMDAGSRRINVTEGTLTNLSVRSVYDIAK